MSGRPAPGWQRTVLKLEHNEIAMPRGKDLNEWHTITKEYRVQVVHDVGHGVGAQGKELTNIISQFVLSKLVPARSLSMVPVGPLTKTSTAMPQAKVSSEE